MWSHAQSKGGTLAVPEAGRSTRGLALAVACLLLAGVVSAGVRAADGDRPGRAVVSAVGDQSGTVDVTSTVTVTLPVQPSTPPIVETTTTLPRAAVDVLNAIRTTTTTRRPATTTTRPPTPTTTAPTPTTAPSTTTTVARFRVTLLNNHPSAVELIVNGRSFPLTPSQEVADVDLPLSARGDVIQVRVGQDCGGTDSGVIFKAGGSYNLTVVPGETMCNGGTARPRLILASR